MAPEIYHSKASPCNAKMTDVFSLGVLFFILAFGAPPFHQAQDSDSYFQFLKAQPKGWNFFESHPHTMELCKKGLLSESLMQMLMSMLQPDPKDRMQNLQEIFSYNFMW